MKANYKNWVPRSMICWTGGLALISLAAALMSWFILDQITPWVRLFMVVAFILGAVFMGVICLWCLFAHRAFSYHGNKQLARHITEGVARYVILPQGGTGLDVGCGSGALTIASAKQNPQASMIGVDLWSGSYTSYSQALCENNAQAEGVRNTRFQPGNAVHLDFADETFDAVTSNYVYHNISGINKQQLLLETLRTLKKGGCFALHDIMTLQRYGDMNQFVRMLKDQGYEKVHLLVTSNGKLISEKDAKRFFLTGSTLLYGIK